MDKDNSALGFTVQQIEAVSLINSFKGNMRDLPLDVANKIYLAKHGNGGEKVLVRVLNIKASVTLKSVNAILARNSFFMAGLLTGSHKAFI
ncbi:UNVERIFIED_CONTAM: hypothetical protein KWG02_04625 [Acinetobacter baumannii]